MSFQGMIIKNIVLAGCDNHLAQALPHVGEACGQAQHCHDLTGEGQRVLAVVFFVGI